MSALLTYSEQQTYKAISVNNQGKYPQIELEVENNELRDLLGVALLQDLQNNPSTAANVKLLSGATMVDQYGNTVIHKGIKYVLAYLVFSRYLGESFIQDTFTGFVTKNRPDSETISEGAIKRLQQSNRETAMKEWELIKYYLDTNGSTYPLWYNSISSNPYTPKFSGIRKTRLGQITGETYVKFINPERYA